MKDDAVWFHPLFTSPAYRWRRSGARPGGVFGLRPLDELWVSVSAIDTRQPPWRGKEVSAMDNTEAVGIETEATTDPAGGPDSQVDFNGDFNGEQ